MRLFEHIRGGGKSAASWTSQNPVLPDGVLGQERDTRKVKVGDGSTAWNSLPYLSTSGSGGSAWGTEESVGGTIADWLDDGAGTWTFDAGVISQTDPTADAMLLSVGDYPSLDYVVQADVRFPSGQDSGTTMLAVVSAGNPEAITIAGNTGTTYVLGDGAALTGDGLGDQSILGLAWIDGGPDPATGAPAAPVAPVAQDEWHTLRAVVSPVRQLVYIDGEFFVQSEVISGGNAIDVSAYPRQGCVGLGAVGLVDFRNVKVWTRALPS